MFQQFRGILLLIYLIRQYSFLLIFINANLLIESQTSYFFEFLSIMNCSNVLFYVTFCRKAKLTNVSHERPLSFMNRSNMSVQITSMRKPFFTNITFEGFHLIMNKCNTRDVCRSKLPFWEHL